MMQLPLYWQKHLNEKIKIIKANQKKAGDNCPDVIMLTDIHWNYNNHYSASLIKVVLNECNIPYYFNGGDVVSGAGICSAESVKKDIISCQKLFSDTLDKCLIVEGNHDSAFSTFEAPDYFAENIPLKEFNDLYFGYLKKYPHIKSGKGGAYYYADWEPSKTRYVVLNTHDVPTDKLDEYGKPIFNKFRCFGMREEQLKWFCNEALNVPDSSWNVILCSHEGPALNEDATFIYNYDAVVNIINLFRKHKKGTIHSTHKHSEYDINIDVDFENKGGNFIMWLTGHTHVDQLIKVGGINCVTTATDSRYNRALNIVERHNNTDDQSFDVFTVDTKHKKVYITRIGKGSDREFTYETF